MKHHSSSTHLTRRHFLKHTATVAGAAVCLPSIMHCAEPSDVVRIAVIGLGNKGKQHAELFSGLPGVRVTALCDVDPKRLESLAERLKQRIQSPFKTTDPRQIIERKDVDAVVIATPNHWHALLTVWALRSGKDVYVEKPVSHNIWEGLRMVEEAKRSNRIVQAGQQYRSCPGLRAAAAWLKEGHVGKLLWGHIVWYEYRPAIGKCAPFKPNDLDYDLWCGPAPAEPLARPQLHYDWHWLWSTGNGDMGNSTVHPFDACRMFLPDQGFPRRVISMGGRFTYDDAAESPNTQFTLLEYPNLPIVIENRNLPMEKSSLGKGKDNVVMDQYRRVREGIILQYEGGYFAGLRAGGVVLDNSDKEIKRFPGNGGAEHQANFIQAVRSRKADSLNSPLAEAHISAAVCHLSNISYRLGSPGTAVSCLKTMGKHPPATEGFPRLVKSLEDIGVDLGRTPFALGPWLEVDHSSGDILKVAGGDAGKIEQARRLARGAYRSGYELPV